MTLRVGCLLVQTQVNRVMAAITSVESNIDNVKTSADEMKRELDSMVSSESSKLFDAVTTLANSEADSIVSNARTKAEVKSEKIKQTGQDNIAKIQTNIDSNFEAAVKYSVSEILSE